MKQKKITKTKKRRITNDHLAIRELRLELNLTQAIAGKLIGLSAKGVEAIENGRVSLNRNRIEEILNSYNFSYLDFLRVRKLIEKNSCKRRKRITIKTVLKNEDRRSYQKLITKEVKVLKSMRRIKGLTQYKASKLCGYNRSAIGHIENGRIELSTDRIKHIIESYGYKYRDFENNMHKEEQRDTIIDFCIERIETLDDRKLDIVKNLLRSL